MGFDWVVIKSYDSPAPFSGDRTIRRIRESHRSGKIPRSSSGGTRPSSSSRPLLVDSMDPDRTTDRMIALFRQCSRDRTATRKAVDSFGFWNSAKPQFGTAHLRPGFENSSQFELADFVLNELKWCRLRSRLASVCVSPGPKVCLNETPEKTSGSTLSPKSRRYSGNSSTWRPCVIQTQGLTSIMDSRWSLVRKRRLRPCDRTTSEPSPTGSL